MIHKILYNKKILKEEFKDENKSIYIASLFSFAILFSLLILFAFGIITKDISYLNLFSSFLIVHFGSHLLSTLLLMIINKVFYNREKYFEYKIQKAEIKDLKYRISIQKAEIETLDSLLISKITNNKSDLSSFLKNLQKRHNISLIRFFAIVLVYLKFDTLDKLLDHIKNLDEKEILTLFIKALNSKSNSKD
jgi:transcriptional regulator NrdR family protein